MNNRKIDYKRVIKLIKDSKIILVATEKGNILIGNTPKLLTVLTVLIQNMERVIPKETLKLSYDLAFSTEKERMDMFLKSPEDMLKKFDIKEDEKTVEE